MTNAKTFNKLNLTGIVNKTKLQVIFDKDVTSDIQGTLQGRFNTALYAVNYIKDTAKLKSVRDFVVDEENNTLTLKEIIAPIMNSKGKRVKKSVGGSLANALECDYMVIDGTEDARNARFINVNTENVEDHISTLIQIHSIYIKSINHLVAFLDQDIKIKQNDRDYIISTIGEIAEDLTLLDNTIKGMHVVYHTSEIRQNKTVPSWKVVDVFSSTDPKYGFIKTEQLDVPFFDAELKRMQLEDTSVYKVGVAFRKMASKRRKEKVKAMKLASKLDKESKHKLEV